MEFFIAGLAEWLKPAHSQRRDLPGLMAHRVVRCSRASEKGTVPFCSEDFAKLGQSPAVLLHALIAY
jgi:hypothetical protein